MTGVCTCLLHGHSPALYPLCHGHSSRKRSMSLIKEKRERAKFKREEKADEKAKEKGWALIERGKKILKRLRKTKWKINSENRH